MLVPAAQAASSGIFWTNWDDGSGTTVGRAALGGGGVHQSLVSGAKAKGVAVDRRYIYWTDPIGGRIGRAKRNGSAVYPS